MRFSARALFAVVFVVVVAPFLCGQHADGPNAPCPYQFTVGKTNSNTYIQYCVTDNGNLSSIETPFGHPMLAPDGEGYGLCQESPAVEYHDYIGSSSGWNPARSEEHTSELQSLTNLVCRLLLEKKKKKKQAGQKTIHNQ